MKPSEPIRTYHERTKHRLNAYARGPEYLDWDNQPDPFRRFAGAPLQVLPLVPDPTGGRAALTLDAVSKLLELSLGLSAWKAFGPDRWALRCNPSSGNLHPTEAYLVGRGIDGLEDGVYHYAPREHALERRAGIVATGAAPECLIGLSSILWREAWKYGERAFRYVQLDVGHALGAVRYAAAVLGWQAEPVSLGNQQIAALLGLDRADDFTGAEREHPDLMLRLLPAPNAGRLNLPQAVAWQGKANALGGEPNRQWPLVDQAETVSPCEAPDYPVVSHAAGSPHTQAELAVLIRQRRSAQAFIGKQSGIDLATFAALLRATLANPAQLPWDVWTQPARVHPVLFVHRIEGLEPGIYVLPRHQQAAPLMQAAMSGEFLWEPVDTLADEMALYRLAFGDARAAARALSCHQEIASASSFSLAMLAEFDNALQTDGPCAYRHLHWEAGLIGQALYLEAEAHGLRGTGIGCFFDDSVHMTLGIEGTGLQSVYHFTVGMPHVDTRLQTLPPYAHRQGGQ